MRVIKKKIILLKCGRAVFGKIKFKIASK